MRPLSENDITAIYLDMRNKGQNAVLQLGGPIITIEEWRRQQLADLARRSSALIERPSDGG